MSANTLNLRRIRKRQAGPQKPEATDTQIARIDALTATGRTNWFALLAYLAFVTVITLGVEDIDFFVNSRQTQLPIVGVSIPTFSFFIFAPVLGAALYVYLHLHIRKVTEALSKPPLGPPPSVNGSPIETRIKPWLLNDFVLRQRRDEAVSPRPLDTLSWLIIWALVWCAGPFSLGLMWWRGWPAHNLLMSAINALCLMVAIYSGTLSWTKMRRDVGRRTNSREIFATIMCTLLCLPVAWLTAVNSKGIAELVIEHDPYADDTTRTWVERKEAWVRAKAIETERTIYDRLAIWSWESATGLAQLDPPNLSEVRLSVLPPEHADLYPARHRYRVQWCQRYGIPPAICGDNTVISDDAVKALWQARQTWCAHAGLGDCDAHFNALYNDFSDREWPAYRSAMIAAIDKPNLAGKDLRAARLNNAELWGIDFSGAKLEGADLSGAKMEGADLSRANIERANLHTAKLEGADLHRVKMNGADLRLVKMEGADLRWAEMKDARLRLAEMQGVNLSGAKMDRADLRLAEMEGANLSGATLDGANLSATQLKGANLGGLIWKEAQLSLANLDEANLSGAEMDSANLLLAKLNGANLSEAKLDEANLSGAEMNGANLLLAKLNRAILSEAKLDGANLSGAKLEGAILNESEMVGADLREAQLKGANLSLARMDMADLRWAELKGANLSFANLEGANLSRAKMGGTVLIKARMERADLRSAEMEEANLARAQLVGANLSLANLEGANLSQADIGGADLRWAKINGADLRGATLENADLRWAQLTGADLSVAKMEGANLNLANLEGANLRGAKMEGANLNWATLTGTADEPMFLETTNLKAVTNSGGSLRFVDLRPATFDAKSNFKNSFGDATAMLPDTIDRPCQWATERLSDAEFFARWRGWIEVSPVAIESSQVWAIFAPQEWKDVDAMPPPEGCEWHE